MFDLQLTYKKKYEATKNKWIWTADRPDFLNAAKNSLQQSDVSRAFFALDMFPIFPKHCCSNLASLQVEYKYDKEIMKGCVIPVVDDKLTLLALKNNEMNSYVS